MSEAENQQSNLAKYAKVQRVLHWGIAALVLISLAGGLLLGLMGFESVTDTFGGGGRDLIYEYHKTFGLLILALMLIRLFVRFEHATPHYPASITPSQKLASSLVHYLLYVLLLAMPVLGWAATDALNYPVEFFAFNLPQLLPKSQKIGALLFDWHRYIGWTLCALLVLHIGAALMHWLILKDGVMQRMSLH